MRHILLRETSDRSRIKIHIDPSYPYWWHGARIEDDVVDSHWDNNVHIGYDLTQNRQRIYKSGKVFGEVLTFLAIFN